MKTPKINDEVTCKIEVDAYYSNYGITPKIVFKPGMKGIIKAIMPKVSRFGPKR